MAVMIPEKPHKYEPASREGIMFEALSKLTDEYYVFHSFKNTVVLNNRIEESEMDFLVFNRNKGIICIEAKAGNVRYEDGYWCYSNGERMHNGGPFNQADTNKWNLINYIRRNGIDKIKAKCKFLHAVWFPSISQNDLNRINFPSEADKKIVLTKEALTSSQKYIDEIYDIDVANITNTRLSREEEKKLLYEILCPQFNVFPSATYDLELKKMVFHRLLNEQANILNFLEEQKTAVINGAAGTGKTMIALEKARRHAANEEKVLFLCYNVKLRDYLATNYEHKNISYYTLSALACKLCNTISPDYNRLKIILEDMYLSENFPFQHIIIDEGQDFGMDDVEEADILNVLYQIVYDFESSNRTFYVFYDKLQLVQANRIPKYIEDADCKLTLYKNCRNTENIAITSLKPISNRNPRLIEGAIKGTPSKLHFCNSENDVIQRVDFILDELIKEGYKDIVLLTCKTEDKSVVFEHVKNGTYRKKYKFSTCRKFKGLEADAVVLLDLDTEIFDEKNIMIYYVGTSRARLKLDIVTMITREECTEILKDKLSYKEKIRNPQKDLAKVLNAIGSIAIEI